jgi:hypothetical protein
MSDRLFQFGQPLPGYCVPVLNERATGVARVRARFRATALRRRSGFCRIGTMIPHDRSGRHEMSGARRRESRAAMQGLHAQGAVAAGVLSRTNVDLDRLAIEAIAWAR